MGRSRFVPILLIAALLAVSVSQGSGRKLMETAEYEAASTVQFEEPEGEPRMVIEVMDYPDPQPNVNPKTGVIPPPSQG